ncbi:tRNA (adenosine(37)-N6)-threonylcarbamoyltransferase complex dimerization subunit type 1 TsaB [Paenibacillus glycinis]|uniref:tRNA (Adenosine(37)-N6)-threonylcarbamoyltransferase complex dimerization subunit type 1 TsaB n=1 Tax=Paenibacillus glycinis TaxID=2697035 RepID=A0ABW9XPW5_9BACL|nr:tRNA (adenosine(37)-N6)-threonylcarbamoyltransferase complex dimerization subunit type 1 TsaB [Paenibacillus glycinis]NBD24434.1 tRNA (adenosine(37)-N6)-threonylcarbamoyltransferase complex dimerization subunit type 1 TsaB [Paenibacillus glycinis]
MDEHRTLGGPDGPLVLAVDTSTAALAAALVRGGEVLREVQSLAERNHSVHTVTTVHAMLAECGVQPEELDGIAIGRGPGSYTGMRIAVSLGKTLAWVWDKPLVGISSLEALGFGRWLAEREGRGDASSADVVPSEGAIASGGGLISPSAAVVTGSAMPVPVEQAPLGMRTPGHAWIVPIMDARRGQVYTASFSAGEENVPGGWERLASDAIRLMRDWVDELAEAVAAADDAARPAAIWIVGELALHEAEADRLQALCPGVQVRKLPAWMEGRAVAALGAKRLAAGERDDVHAFAPNYTQLTEAEVKLQEKQTKETAAEGAVRDDAN